MFRQIRKVLTFSGESQKHFQLKQGNIPTFSEKSEKYFNIFRKITETFKLFQADHPNIPTFFKLATIEFR